MSNRHMRFDELAVGAYFHWEYLNEGCFDLKRKIDPEQYIWVDKGTGQPIRPMPDNPVRVVPECEVDQYVAAMMKAAREVPTDG